MSSLSVSGVQGVWGVLGVQGVEGGLGGPKSGGYVPRSRGFWGGGSLPQSKVCMSSLSVSGVQGVWGVLGVQGVEGGLGGPKSGGYVPRSRGFGGGGVPATE